MEKLRIRLLQGTYAVCQIKDTENFLNCFDEKDFFSITKTEDEISVVMLQDKISSDVKVEKDWRILKVEGTLDFSLIGILAKISGILAKNSISIFVISTFNTDYILVKEEKIEKAMTVLSKEGYEISK
ncbi:MAG: ACT domain-containing protein [Fusobacteriaceae bacterium]|nr:ACT domain-containing protein [Fusobacteriaceae bacterium]